MKAPVFSAISNSKASTAATLNELASTKTTADFQPGQLVRFMPHHANGDLNSRECENGRVTSTNDRFVFVRFGQSESGQACDPQQLF